MEEASRGPRAGPYRRKNLAQAALASTFSDGGTMRERRRKKRLRLARYLKVFERTSEAFIGHLVDLNMGGMLLVSERPILPGTRLELSVEILQKKPPLSVEAVWCEEDSRLESYNIGCRLLEIPPDALAIIQALVQALEARS